MGKARAAPLCRGPLIPFREPCSIATRWIGSPRDGHGGNTVAWDPHRRRGGCADGPVRLHDDVGRVAVIDLQLLATSGHRRAQLPDGPYVVVAVDNHFHDIHPSDPPTIAANRPFEVKNEATTCNFSVIGPPSASTSRPAGTSGGPTSAPA
jgi:hypothetical protein